MWIERIQGAFQAVIVELGSRNAQHRHQYGLRHPVGDLVQRERKHQTVENQHQRHRAMIDFSLSRAMSIDDLPHLQRFQQGIQHRQCPQLMAQLTGRQPVHHLCHRHHSL